MTDGEHLDDSALSQPTGEKSSLRSRAYAKYRESLGDSYEQLVELPAEEVIKIVRELRVHQIELELQNEELLQSQLALEESRARFRDLYDHAPVGYCLVDANDDRIQDANTTLGEMLGYDPAGLNNHRFCAFIEPSHQDEFYHLKRRILASRHADSCELQLKRSDGGCIWVQLYVTVASIDLGTSSLRVSLMNIDARMRAEAAKTLLENQLRESQKMEAVGTLASGIAHDFNNILTVIIVNSEVVLRLIEESVPRAVLFVKEIQKATSRARDLIRQILAFCRKQPTDLHTISLADVIQESIGLLRSTMPPRFDLQFTSDADVPQVFADSTQIEQVIINLATNAMQAMNGKAGRLCIHLDSMRLDKQIIQDHQLYNTKLAEIDQVVRIVFADNGPGMEPAVAERIFEPFFTTKPVNEGTGLGLAVVQGIVRAHDGEILVETELGHGTTFTIYLPPTKRVEACDASLPTLNAPPINSRIAQSSQSGEDASELELDQYHVLYVDDDQFVLKSVVRLLKEHGIVVSGYTDPTAVLDLLRSSSTTFKILVTDYNMPGLSGLEFAKHVHKLRPDLPVVIISGFIDDELRAHARDAGVVSLMEKPFSTNHFLQLLAEITQGVDRP